MSTFRSPVRRRRVPVHAGIELSGSGQFCLFPGLADSKSAVERDLQHAGQQAKSLHEQAPRMRVRVLGADGTGARMAGEQGGMLFFVDIERQQLVCVEPVQETDAPKVRQHIQRVMEQTGAGELRTDELSVYEHTAAARHTVCLAHWLKSKCKRAWELARLFEAEGMSFEAQTMRELIELLHRYRSSAALPAEIERLVRRFINCREGLLWKANQLLQHIERTWSSVSRDPVDPTNNTTERIIGLTYKIRAKTMRGFKSWTKALAHPYLTRSSCGARMESAICERSIQVHGPPANPRGQILPQSLGRLRTGSCLNVRGREDTMIGLMWQSRLGFWVDN